MTLASPQQHERMHHLRRLLRQLSGGFFSV
jgi:hypothetical protein